MNLKTAICDDNLSDAEIIEHHIQIFEMQHDITFEHELYENSQELLTRYSRPGMYHILFLDVEMPELSGLELAKRIRALPDDRVKIVFISSYPEYMQNSFDVQAFHYLTKPVSYEQFCSVMNKIVLSYSHSSSCKIVISEGGNKRLLYLDDIIYLQTQKDNSNYLNIFLKGEKLVIRGVLSQWEKELQNHSFSSPKRGILVNLNHLTSYSGNSICLSDGTKLHISRRKEQEFKMLFSKHIITLQH